MSFNTIKEEFEAYRDKCLKHCYETCKDWDVRNHLEQRIDDPLQSNNLLVRTETLLEAGYKEGDEVWWWNTPKSWWKNLHGSAGYCIIRDGEVFWTRVVQEN